MSKRLVCRAILVSAVLSALLVPGCTTKEECAKAVDGGAGVDQQRDQQQNVSPQCLTAYKKLKACVDAWDCQALTDAAAKAACLMRQQLLKSDTLPATLKTPAPW